MKPLSPTMKRVLKIVNRSSWVTAAYCRCSYRTFVALERRGLIRVMTTFGSLVNPHHAEAVPTDAGRKALKTR